MPELHCKHFYILGFTDLNSQKKGIPLTDVMLIYQHMEVLIISILNLYNTLITNKTGGDQKVTLWIDAINNLSLSLNIYIGVQ